MPAYHASGQGRARTEMGAPVGFLVAIETVPAMGEVGRS